MSNPKPAVQPPEPSRALRSLRVLVVEDDRDALWTLMLLLQDEGHEVRGLHNGERAMAVLEGLEPDVVLLDIGLPDQSGYDIARQIRERCGENRPPVLIAITAWGRTTDRMLAQMAGFDHHLPKPYDTKALLALLAPLRVDPGSGEAG